MRPDLIERKNIFGRTKDFLYICFYMAAQLSSIQRDFIKLPHKQCVILVALAITNEWYDLAAELKPCVRMLMDEKEFFKQVNQYIQNNVLQQ